LGEVSSESYSELEELLKKKKGKMSLLGPYSTGVYNPTSNIDMIHLPPTIVQRPKLGHLGVISSDYETGLAFMDIAAQEGLGFSKYINVGECLDISTGEAIEFLIDDSQTQAIFVLASYVRKKDEFNKALERAWKVGKPVLLYANKPQSLIFTKSSYVDFSSYTPANELKEHQDKTISALYLDHAADLSKAFASRPFPKGPKVALIANSLGAARFSIDAVLRRNLTLGTLTKETNKEIGKVMPADCNRTNPVYARSTTPEYQLVNAIDPVLNDPNIDLLLFAMFPTHTLLNPTQFGVLLGRVLKKATKPVFLVLPPGEDRLLLEAHLEGLNLPIYTTPHRAARSIEALLNYSNREKPTQKKTK
jgi:acetyltransferase